MTTAQTPTTAPVEFDPELPTFVVLVDGKVLFRTQTPGRAFQAVQALKHGRKVPSLVIENDRRSTPRSEA